MADAVTDAIASMDEQGIRGVWWRLNDPVLRKSCPEEPGLRAAVIDRAKALRIDLNQNTSTHRRRK